MFQLSKEHAGQKIKFRFNNFPKNAIGTVIILDNVFYVASSDPRFDGGYPFGTPQQPYVYSFSKKGLISRETMAHVEKVWMDIIRKELLTSKRASGNTFRKIYRRDDNLLFLGPIKKSMEECEEPAAVISVMDVEYVKKMGWVEYTEEPSLESRVTEKSTKIVN